MTITTTAVDVTYSPDGAVTVFAIPFAFADIDHVVVELDAVVLSSGYSITGAGDEDGGTLTFEDAPAAGTETLYVYRQTPAVQEIAPVNNASIFATVLGRGLDIAAMRHQELEAYVNRAIDEAGDLIGLIGKASLSDLIASTGATLVGYVHDGLNAVTRTVRARLRDRASLLDYIPVAEHAAILAGTSTYDATAGIQAAFNAASKVHAPGSRAGALYRATALTLPHRTTVVGDGPRASVLYQIPGTMSDFITCLDGGVAADITEGASGFMNIGVTPAAVPYVGIRVGPGIKASMFQTDRLRLASQHAATLTTLPYDTTSGQIGILFDGGSGGSVFLNDHRQLEIRSFDIAIDAKNSANEGVFTSTWLVDNRIGLRLTDCSTWRPAITFESGVTNARCAILAGTTSNIHFLAGDRWELTQGGVYGLEFAGGFTGANIRVWGPSTLLNGDGAALPGRKWTGTPPADFVFHGFYYDLEDAAVRPVMYVPGDVAMRMPSKQRIGGSGLGDFNLTLSRNGGGANAGWYYRAADGNTYLYGINALRLCGDSLLTSYKVAIDGTGVGFNGTNPVGKQTLGAAATDLASVIALSNNIRTAMINNGTGQN